MCTDKYGEVRSWREYGVASSIKAARNSQLPSVIVRLSPFKSVAAIYTIARVCGGGISRHANCCMHRTGRQHKAAMTTVVTVSYR